MDRVELRVFHDHEVDGVRRRQAFGLGRYFSHIPAERRKRTAAHHCPVGGELTRDYWYSHDTGKAGDLKLCREHEVTEIADVR